MEKRLFITFEGVEGSGKSTQLDLAAEWLSQRKHEIVCTREPGGTAIGKEIRKILLSEQNATVSPLSETLLYMADRFQHLKEVIRPALESGRSVLCDRYHDSTLAYQGYARKIPIRLLDEIWNSSDLSLNPHYTFLLDIDPEIGIKRSLAKLARAKVDESRFEKETLGFHRRVREGFLALANQHPQRIIVINAGGAVDAIHQQIVQYLTNWFGS